MFYHVRMRWDGQRADDEAALFGRDAVARTFDTPGFRGMTFYEVYAKSIINQVPPASRMPFQYTINPYRGCGHACAYCFARNTHTYLDLDAGLDFNSKIIVKVNAPELARTAVEVAASLAEGRTVAWGRLAPTAPSIFGPAHGVADSLAGQGVANPSSMLLAAALMLAEGLGERSGAETLSGAVGRAGDGARRPSTRGHADLVLSQLPVTAANAEFYREAACG